jgi:hypothetical protein
MPYSQDIVNILYQFSSDSTSPMGGAFLPPTGDVESLKMTVLSFSPTTLQYNSFHSYETT